MYISPLAASVFGGVAGRMSPGGNAVTKEKIESSRSDMAVFDTAQVVMMVVVLCRLVVMGISYGHEALGLGQLRITRELVKSVESSNLRRRMQLVSINNAGLGNMKNTVVEVFN